MLYGGGFGVILLALWAYSIFDCIRTDSSLCENLPKPLWLMIVIFVPTVGSLAWLLLGRPHGAKFGFESSGPRAVRAAEPSAPPGDALDHARRRDEALRRHEEEREAARQQRDIEIEQLRLAAWEDELRRREQELRRDDE